MRYQRPVNWDNRRWQAGWGRVVDGLPVRVRDGEKKFADLVLEWETTHGWRPVTMSFGALMADFFWENEELLHPFPQKGGDYYLRDYLQRAVRDGWIGADALLRSERGTADDRREVRAVENLFGRSL